MSELTYRHAVLADAPEIARVEAFGFPPEEAATLDSLAERIQVFGDQFILLEQDGKLVSFINGMVSDQRTITDDLFEDASLHNPQGSWQMVFGLVTHPDFQKQGLARKAMNALIEQAKSEHRKGLVLTCKEHLIPFYESFRYVNEGVSGSEHGGATWYDLRLTF